MATTKDAGDLVTLAQLQLDEHKRWLAAELEKLPTYGDYGVANSLDILAWQAGEIRLRVVRTDGRVASVVYEYPDELYAFLRSDHAPSHLRDSLAGGHVVDPNQPASSAKREA